MISFPASASFGKRELLIGTLIERNGLAVSRCIRARHLSPRCEGDLSITKDRVGDSSRGAFAGGFGRHQSKDRGVGTVVNL